MNTKDRPCPHVIPPESKLLYLTELLDEQNFINLQRLRDHQTREGRMVISDLYQLIQRSQALFKKDPTLIHIDSDVIIVGDLHCFYLPL